MDNLNLEMELLQDKISKFPVGIFRRDFLNADRQVNIPYKNSLP
jgi:hypothetical protein